MLCSLMILPSGMSGDRELRLPLSLHVHVTAVTPLHLKTNTPDKKSPFETKMIEHVKDVLVVFYYTFSKLCKFV